MGGRTRTLMPPSGRVTKAARQCPDLGVAVHTPLGPQLPLGGRGCGTGDRAGPQLAGGPVGGGGAQAGERLSGRTRELTHVPVLRSP